MKNVKTLSDEVHSVVEGLRSIELDTDNMDKSPADMEVVAWYEERFRRCKEDGVPEAINCYLEKLLHEDVNDLTRLLILQASMN